MDKKKKTPLRDEEKEIVCLFDFEEEKCDATFITKDKKLKMPSSFLCYVSDAFKEELKEHSKVITDVKFSSDVVVTALSYYRPQFYKGDKGLRPYEFALKWKLTPVIELCSNKILDMKQNFDGKVEAIDILILSYDRFNSTTVLEFYLSKSPFLSSSFLRYKNTETVFKSLQKEIKYELLKNTYIREIKKGVKTFKQKSLLEIEIIFIFNFFDALIHHESLDNSTCVFRKRKFPWQNDESSLSKKTVPDSDGFLLEHPDTNVTLVIDEYKLYVNSLLLTGSSPVFKAMLDSSFKEAHEKVIQLPGKDLSDMMNFLAHLKQPGKKIDLESTHFISLCQLCQEYQTDWLAAKISKILENFKVPPSNENDGKLLELINVSKLMGWKNAVKHLTDQISDTFMILQTLPEFAKLDVDVKVLIARQRLWKFAIEKEDEFDLDLVRWLINTKEVGLLSIFSSHEHDIFNIKGSLCVDKS